MNKQLSWNQISQNYKGHWVELVDFEWDWNSAYPSRARIRNASSDRNLLMSKIRSQGEIENSVVIFVGTVRSVIGSLTENNITHPTL